MSAEYVDVVIVGAGLSGIGAAHHLKEKCPRKSFLILESRDAIGGTWDLFRYPGVRSDSDMHTLGYSFRPWEEAKAIADGPAILRYIRDTAKEDNTDERVLFAHQLQKADWSTREGCWILSVLRLSSGDTIQIRCNFLQMCSGYFSYRSGYRPAFPNEDSFQGLLVHPQQWPENLNYQGKRVVIIGSGATAVTLAPEMAKKAAQVVMLQRSPTYVVSAPDKDMIANVLRAVLPSRLAYAITRWKNVAFQKYIYRRSRRAPDKLRKALLDRARREVGDAAVEQHFTPTYNPWDQRLCLIPNADLFRSIREGRTRMVTDRIARFLPTGVELESGMRLDADIIVTATGLKLLVLGGVEFAVDGELIDFSGTVTYKGMMFSDVPNMVYTFGYINASWTLRADLTAEFVCRLLNHMDQKAVRQCTPRLTDADRTMTLHPFIENFTSGYMQRMLPDFPKQGDRAPWLNPQDYGRDRKMIRKDVLEDGHLIFDNPEPEAVLTN